MVSSAVAILAITSAIPLGRAAQTIDVQGVPLEVFSYKPIRYQRERIILVLHGTLRNAEEYRNHAEGMAERFNALVVAPKFDLERFPSRLYQRGGLLREDGSAAPQAEWTYRLIPALIEQVRKRERRNIPFWVIGHSAGGQFIVRMAAFWDTGAERLVAANAGSHLFPRFDWPFGYGFGNLPDTIANTERLRAYLAAPLTLYQGRDDNKPDEYFDTSLDAMRQGEGRFQRAKAAFAFAKRLAADKGWKFNWKMVEVPEVGHDHEAMFDSPRAEQALFGRKPW